jgi:hypothetical protein
MSKEVKSKQDLISYIEGVVGKEKLIAPMIEKQIHRYTLEDNKTFNDIAVCFDYVFVILKKDFIPMYGIGLLQYFWDESRQYFRKQELELEKKTEETRTIVNNQTHNIIFNIRSVPNYKRSPKKIDISKLGVDADKKDKGGSGDGR